MTFYLSFRLFFILSCLFGPNSTTCFVPPRDSFSNTRFRNSISLFSTKSTTTLSNNENTALNGLTVAIVGGGPSGLLLAHKLVSNGAHVSLFESRSRPQKQVSKESRAYALGIGMRGRTAIQSVDHNNNNKNQESSLWKAVQQVGFASERFHLHVGPFRLRLRDGQKNKSTTTATNETAAEPSMLLYQSDLCRVLLEELEYRWATQTPQQQQQQPQVSIQYDTKVTGVDLRQGRILTTTTTTKSSSNPSTPDSSSSSSYDLIVGCDGVNSMVRQSLQETWPAFATTKSILPGVFKVVQLGHMPPKLDPTAVALLVPKSGTCTAFVEPTVNQGCCVLVAGRSANDTLLASTNETQLQEELSKRFPLLQGIALDTAAAQLAQVPVSTAASVVCNTYHYSSTVALVGDAAHATGGVSGQGVNSALTDAKVLADCLISNFQLRQNKTEALQASLVSYSQRQVPEGHALYDLSFGPVSTTVRQRIRQAVTTLRDSIFRGRWGIGQLPLQTLLTTSLVPFADIRRQRDRFFPTPFPTQREWNESLEQLSKTDLS